MNPVPRRFLVAAFGDPGHAFPAIALGKTLVERGHDVRLQTWTKWQEQVEREGMRFEPAPEYKVFPTAETPGLKPYQAAVRAARVTVPLIEEYAPDAVVADILTVAAGLAAQMAGARWATLIPHVLPPWPGAPGLGAQGAGARWAPPPPPPPPPPDRVFPPFSIGARLPRTRFGSLAWRAFDPLLRGGMEQGRDELNGARERLGLAP